MAKFETANMAAEIRAGGIGLVWVDVAGRPHNVLNHRVFDDLGRTLERLAEDPSLKLLVIASRKESGFFAGADLQGFKAVQGPAEATALSGMGQRFFDSLAGYRVPTVAVIHGICLGGGLELALA